MKKVILALLFALPFTVFSQENESFLIRAKIKQGSILIGGNISGSASSFSDEISTSNKRVEGNRIQAIARAKNGYFIRHDFAVGLDLTFSHESTKITSDAEQQLPVRSTRLLAGPFTRYYLDNGIFGELSLEVGLHNFSSGKKNNLYEAALGVGYAHFINEKFSIEPILSFRYLKESREGKSYISYGPMLGVGVQAYLLRKRAHVIKIGL